VAVRDRRPWAGSLEQSWIGPLWHEEWELDTDGDRIERRRELRPLYSTRRAPERLRRDLLYPLAKWRTQPEGTRGSFLLLGRTRHDTVTGDRETVAGIAYGGKAPDGARYGGLFPLWGTVEKRFGFDRIRFVLWPLYARRSRGGYTETQILWPIFAYGRGDGRFRFRLWPLYGKESQEGVRERRFFLWPFVHHHVTQLDTETPSRMFYLLPLYGRRDNGPFHSRFYLFPLVFQQWDDSNPRAYRLDALWPLFSSAWDGKGGSHVAFRPILDVRRSAERSAWSIGMGILGRSRSLTDESAEDIVRLLWMGRIGWRREGLTEVRWRDVWPLMRFESRRGPDTPEHGFLRVPYVLPFRGLAPDGWDRHYNKLFELYGARWRGDERRSSLLYGLREARESASERWSSWAGFLHFRR
jgi:hypothetical protein